MLHSASSSEREAGHRVLVVLSARGKTTDELIAMAEEVSDAPDPREMDMLLSTGERISCALCAMAIHDLGHRAISLTGSQAGIVTDNSHTKARILDVRAERIVAALEEDQIVLVAGFQGVSTASDVTTLGRGGSDTSGGGARGRCRSQECEIYTDVSGVYSADPRIVPDARKLSVSLLRGDARDGGFRRRACCSCARWSTRATTVCGSIAARHSRTAPVPLCLAEGETDGAAADNRRHTLTSEARVTLVGVPDEPGAAAHIFGALAQANVNVDMIVQNEPSSAGGRAEISFTVPREDLRIAQTTLDQVAGESFEHLTMQPEMGKVSIVGAGMRSHPGVAAKVFGVLAEEGVNIEMISTSPIKISCVIDREHVERAVRALHTAFELSREEGQPAQES